MGRLVYGAIFLAAAIHLAYLAVLGTSVREGGSLEGIPTEVRANWATTSLFLDYVFTSIALGLYIASYKGQGGFFGMFLAAVHAACVLVTGGLYAAAHLLFRELRHGQPQAVPSDSDRTL